VQLTGSSFTVTSVWAHTSDGKVERAMEVCDADTLNTVVHVYCLLKQCEDVFFNTLAISNFHVVSISNKLAFSNMFSNVPSLVPSSKGYPYFLYVTVTSLSIAGLFLRRRRRKNRLSLSAHLTKLRKLFFREGGRKTHSHLFHVTESKEVQHRHSTHYFLHHSRRKTVRVKHRHRRRDSRIFLCDFAEDRK
jgi:hypothetical protein